jgi:hypothetical protein
MGLRVQTPFGILNLNQHVSGFTIYSGIAARH